MLTRFFSRLGLIVMVTAGTFYADRAEAQSQAPTPSVAGTTWAGTDSEGDYYEYTFQADGVLAYLSPSGFFKNGAWNTARGNSIYMETNKKFSERRGQIAGMHMQGEARNVQGHKWTWSADKK